MLILDHVIHRLRAHKMTPASLRFLKMHRVEDSKKLASFFNAELWTPIMSTTYYLNMIPIYHSQIMAICARERSWGESSPMFCPKNPLPLSKRFCSLPLYAPSAMRCSRATCAGYIARDAWALQLNPPFKHISINDGCSLSKNSWISSRPASWISSSINMVKRNFKRYLINILTSITPPSWNTL